MFITMSDKHEALMVTAEKKTEEAPVFMSTVFVGSQTMNPSVYVVIREQGAIGV